jgi:hypothetical protein
MMQNDLSKLHAYFQGCIGLLREDHPKLVAKLKNEQGKGIAAPGCDTEKCDPKITAEDLAYRDNQRLRPDYDVGISGMASQEAKQSPKYPSLPYPNHPNPYPRY